jgi:pimeloyl-ACP methyl ester carboxylesterase
VLLCPPAVQEYNRTHWAFRKLASLLAREGFHVLRFDYFGSGDSAGEPEQAGVERWCADIREAACELQDLAETRRVSVVGFRLGAALAALATREVPAVRDLVLWEPAVSGRLHVRELREIQRSKLRLTTNPARTGPDELLGYAFPTALRADIERIGIDELAGCQAERVLLFATERRAEHLALCARLRDRGGVAVRHDTVREDASDRLDGVLLSTRVQQAIATALAGVGR